MRWSNSSFCVLLQSFCSYHFLRNWKDYTKELVHRRQTSPPEGTWVSWFCSLFWQVLLKMTLFLRCYSFFVCIDTSLAILNNFSWFCRYFFFFNLCETTELSWIQVQLVNLIAENQVQSEPTSLRWLVLLVQCFSN